MHDLYDLYDLCDLRDVYHLHGLSVRAAKLFHDEGECCATKKHMAYMGSHSRTFVTLSR